MKANYDYEMRNFIIGVAGLIICIALAYFMKPKPSKYPILIWQVEASEPVVREPLNQLNLEYRWVNPNYDTD